MRRKRTLSVAVALLATSFLFASPAAARFPIIEFGDDEGWSDMPGECLSVDPPDHVDGIEQQDGSQETEGSGPVDGSTGGPMDEGGDDDSGASPFDEVLILLTALLHIVVRS
jgi:hypothetical protein